MPSYKKNKAAFNERCLSRPGYLLCSFTARGQQMMASSPVLLACTAPTITKGPLRTLLLYRVNLGSRMWQSRNSAGEEREQLNALTQQWLCAQQLSLPQPYSSSSVLWLNDCFKLKKGG